jgi:predicted nucleotidyltransferase
MESKESEILRSMPTNVRVFVQELKEVAGSNSATYLHGSRVTGRNTANSDWDIAVFCEEGEDMEKIKSWLSGEEQKERRRASRMDVTVFSNLLFERKGRGFRGHPGIGSMIAKIGIDGIKL